ncbi:hypothetical protein [Wenyingzhuangia sp. IMCC45574]
MEASLHFVFEIIKISILGCFYATLTLIIFLLLGKIFPQSYFSQRTKMKKEIWWFSGLIISFLLFIYMFTYSGDHGLGDGARIPIGYFKEVNEINGTTTSINPKNYQYGSMYVHGFEMSKKYLVGKSEVSPVDRPKPFFSWDLSKDEIVFYNSMEEYNLFAKQNELPTVSEFKTFRVHYRKHWGGWKFWLLP